MQKLKDLEWESINQELQRNGYVILPAFLDNKECSEAKKLFANDNLYRSTIDMKRYNFGKGSYRYFKYPLPDLIQNLRVTFYENLVSSANVWAERTKSKYIYPENFSIFKKMMEDLGQTKSTPLILKYAEGDYNCLHQDIANDLIFPYQVVLGLNEPGVDYEGGQLILTQQRPRMQTIPFIITIPKGGAVIFSSNYHAQLGIKGYYRTVFKHGVGKIESGERYTLGIVFHDYLEKMETSNEQ